MISRHRSVRLVGVAVMLSGIGCSESTEYLDEMEFLPAKEELEEVWLAEFSVPVPAVKNGSKQPTVHGHLLQVQFQLYAVMRPSDKSAVRSEWSRQEGKFREDVMRICRQASLDELTEPEFTTLKGQFVELLFRRLGRRRVRSLVFNELRVRPL